MKRGIVIELTGNILDDLDHAIAVFAVVRRDMQSYLRPISRHVADDLYGSIRDNMECAIGITLSGAAHGALFHGSADRAGTNRVAYLKLVFRQNEEPIDYVFHQGLRAETN